MSRREDGDAVCVVVGSRIGLMTAEPYLRELIARDVPVDLVVPQSLVSNVSHVPVRRVTSVEGLVRTNLGRIVHTVLMWILTGEEAVPGVPFHRSMSLDRLPHPAGVALRRIPKPSASVANWLVHRLVSLVQRNRFRSRRLLLVSHAPYPHLLCVRDLRITTIIESWDHPAKRPAGYWSTVAVAWNPDLAHDWMTFQGADSTLVAYPVKLRGAIQHGAEHDPPRDRPARQLMYAAATSSNSETSLPGMFAEERRLVAELADASHAAGWELLVKPKPNGRAGDFEAIAREFSNVTVGVHGDANDANDYTLDDAYDRRRFAELATCDLVVNTATTFGLDAALAGTPVLQLDLRGHPDWPMISSAQQAYHLRQHLIEGRPGVIELGRDQSLGDSLVRILTDPLPSACEFRDSLERWIAPENSLERSVTDVIDDLLASPDGSGRRLRRGRLSR